MQHKFEYKKYYQPMQNDGRAYYAYSADVFRKRFLDLQAALPPNFHIYYSLKSNPHESFINTIKNESKMGFDVSSINELKKILNTNCDLSNIVYVGPGKRREELELMIKNTNGHIAIESMQEAQLISEISELHAKKVNLLIRINPSYEVHGVKMAMGGKETQFGVMESEIETILKIIKTNPLLTFDGFHTYVGTRILSADDCIQNIINAIDFGFLFHKNVHPIKVLDVGGGIGIPYFLSENDFDLNLFGAKLKDRISHYPQEFIDHIKIILESGRFLSGPSGVFVACIEDVHLVDNKQKIYVNASPTQFGLSTHSKFRNDLIFRTKILSKYHRDAASSFVSDIIGNFSVTCGNFCSNILLPQVFPGDLILFENSGAYGLTAHPISPHSLPIPNIYLDRNTHLEEYGVAS